MTKLLAAIPFALMFSAMVAVPSQASPRLELGLTEALPQGNNWGCNSPEKNDRVNACRTSCRDTFAAKRNACRADSRSCAQRCGSDRSCKASCREDLSRCLAPLQGDLDSCRYSCVSSVAGCNYF